MTLGSKMEHGIRLEFGECSRHGSTVSDVSLEKAMVWQQANFG